MHHLIAAEDFDRAARTIAERGSAWITAGALSSLVAFADALPRVRSKRTRALSRTARRSHACATSTTRRSRSSAARPTLLHEQGDTEGEAEAFHSLATIARRRGDCETAFNYLDRAVELSDERSVVRTKCGNTRGLCLVALGQWTEAEREFRVALQTAEERGDRYYARLIAHNLGAARLHARRLRRGAALATSHAARRGLGRAARAAGSLSHTSTSRAATCTSATSLPARSPRPRARNLPALQPHGAARRDLRVLRQPLPRAARAGARRSNSTTAPSAPTTRPGSRSRAPSCWKSRPARAPGRRPRGGAGAARPPRRRRARTTRWDAGAPSSRARACCSRRARRRRRGADLQPALEYFRAHGLYYYEAQAAMLLAVCEHAAGDEPATLEHLRRALDLAARYDYEYWLRGGVASYPQLFDTPEAAELLPADLREQLPAAGGDGRRAAIARGAPACRAGAARRPDHPHARHGRDLPRPGATLRRRRVGHASARATSSASSPRAATAAPRRTPSSTPSGASRTSARSRRTFTRPSRTYARRSTATSR